MTTLSIAFASAILVSAVLTRIVRDLALARGWVDAAQSSRKIHAKPIPRLGGVAIVLGFFAPLVGLLLVHSDVGEHFRSEPALVLGLLGGGLVIALLGLYDDFRGANAKQKFLVQFGVAAAMYAMGFRIGLVSNPFGEPLALGVLSLPVTLLWIVGVVNAVNLIDGLDGLAGGVAVFGVATNFALAAVRGDLLMCLLMAALAGALVGFLIYNFNPASIFMGDTGSMFLGFVLAVSSLQTSSKSGTVVSMLVPIIALGLPIMDTFLAMGRRFLMGRSMFSADKDHIHHRVMRRWALSHRSTVLVLYSLCGFFALTALGLSMANGRQGGLLLLLVGAVVGGLVWNLGYLDPREVTTMVATRKRNLERRSFVRDLETRLASATAPEHITEALRLLSARLANSGGNLDLALAPELGLSGRVSLPVAQPLSESAPAPSLVVRVPIRSAAMELGCLAVTWRNGQAEVNRDVELALEQTAEAIGRAAARISSVPGTLRAPKVVPLPSRPAAHAFHDAAASMRSEMPRTSSRSA